MKQLKTHVEDVRGNVFCRKIAKKVISLYAFQVLKSDRVLMRARCCKKCWRLAMAQVQNFGGVLNGGKSTITNADRWTDCKIKADLRIAAHRLCQSADRMRRLLADLQSTSKPRHIDERL